MSAPRPRGLQAVPLERLAGLLGVDYAGAAGVAVSGVSVDSGSVVAGDLFAALPGANSHGAVYVSAARDRGAVAVFTDADGAELLASTGVELPVLAVDKPRDRLGAVAALIYGEPSAAMDLVGITGTNGKTTTAYLLEGVLAAEGHTTALIGTIETKIAGEQLPQARTTPEAPELQAILAVALQAGVDAAVMEVSSHALSLGRLNGTKLRAAVFTNLSQDHLDFHGTMDDYFAAKLSMFRPEFAETAVIGVDDEWGEKVMERTRLAHVTYSVTGVPWADWQISDLASTIDGTEFRAVGPAGESVVVTVAIPGAYNAANALAALATGVSLGIDPATAARGIASVAGVPGRLERIDAGQPYAAFVDFAHTPNAVRTVLETLRPLTSGRLVVVLGCGGDRDRGKRPAMARAAVDGADDVIFTSDNPRSEDPLEILREMTDGLTAPYRVEPDRHRAIAESVRGLGAGDTVVVAGKGHETGQEVAGVVTPFDDRNVLRASVIDDRARSG